MIFSSLRSSCRAIFLALLAASSLLPATTVHAATGCNYPTSLDTYADKSTGDFLTVADVNSRSCAIEKLQTGPLRPNKSGAFAPAYSFQGDTDTGMDSPGADILSLHVGGATAALFTTAAAGPHAIGGVTAPQAQLRISGAFIPPDAALVFRALSIESSITVTANREAALFNVAGTLVEAASGTHADFVGARFAPPTITAGAAALTNAATVKITAAPSGATNNYAVWVDSGVSRFDGVVGGDGTALLFGSSGGTEHMRLTDGGILAVGTTNTTGAGKIQLPNNASLTASNAAGTGSVGLLAVDTSDRAVLGPSSGAILFNAAPPTGGSSPVVLCIDTSNQIRKGASATSCI